MLHHPVDGAGEPLLLVIESRDEDNENGADNDDLMKHENKEVRRDDFSLCKGDPPLLLHEIVKPDHNDTICDKNADTDDEDTEEDLEESESISLPLLYSCRDSLD